MQIIHPLFKDAVTQREDLSDPQQILSVPTNNVSLWRGGEIPKSNESLAPRGLTDAEEDKAHAPGGPALALWVGVSPS